MAAHGAAAGHHEASPLVQGTYVLMGLTILAILLATGWSLVELFSGSPANSTTAATATSSFSWAPILWSAGILIILILGVIGIIIAATEAHSPFVAFLVFVAMIFGAWFCYNQGGFEHHVRLSGSTSATAPAGVPDINTDGLGGLGKFPLPPPNIPVNLPPLPQPSSRAAFTVAATGLDAETQSFCEMCRDSSERQRKNLGCDPKECQ